MRHSSTLLLLVISIQLVISQWTSLPAAAEDTTSAPAQNLDLTSHDHSFQASGAVGGVNINVAGAAQTVHPTDMLSAAQYVAVQQILTTGTQTLQLNQLGAATGGQISLTTSLTQNVASLVIPSGVSVYHDAAMMQNLNLTGNLTNFGTLNIFSSNQAINSATVSALNIYNNAGALISANLANLTLSAVNNIVNAGTIRSTGNLNMYAGGAIINTNTAVMQAINNLSARAATLVNAGAMLSQQGNINAVTANLTNSGIMQALSGNLHVAALGSHLNVSNLNGVMSAAKELSFISKLDTSSLAVTGGSVLGSTVNFDAGCGTFDLHVQDIAGVVSVDAGKAFLEVSAGTHPFVLGHLNVQNDPPLVITAASFDDGGAGYTSTGAGDYVQITTTSGGITFTGNINTTPPTSGDGGSVTLNSATFISLADVNTYSNGTGNGGSIIMDAGTTIQTGNINTSGSGSGNAAGSITMTASDGITTTSVIAAGNADASGNDITLTTTGLSADIQVDAIYSSSDLSGNGGAIEINAGGSFLATIGLNSFNCGSCLGGSASGAGGNISVTAGNTINIQDSIDSISYAGGASADNNGGNVTLTALNDISVLGTISTNGHVSGGSGSGNGGAIVVTSQSGAVSVAGITTSALGASGNSGALHIEAGGAITTGNISTNTSNGGDAGAVTLTNSGSPADITVGSIDAYAGVGGTGGGVADPITGQTGINITSTGSFINTGNLDTSSSFFGGSGQGRQINVTVGDIIDVDGWIDASSYGDTSGTDNNGGNITLTAVNGISAPTVVSHGGVGGGDGNGGNIIITTASGTISVLDSIVTNAQGAVGNAGFIHLSAADGITAGLIDAAAVGSTFGNGGAITLLTTGTNADISVGGGYFVSAAILNTGSAGAVVDTVSGNTGIHITATGNVLIDGALDGSASFYGGGGNGAQIVINAGGSVQVNQWLSTTADGTFGFAGDVYIHSGNGISLQSVDTFNDTGGGGDFVAWTGNVNNNASISIQYVNTTGLTSGGMIEIVNSALETSSTNLTITGNLTSDALGLNGRAGAIAVVASGAINVGGNISARADNDLGSTAALGGGVFVSSGSTSTLAGEAITITGTINTSATNNGAGDIAGNIILLSADSSTGADPANITHGTITQTGGTAGTALVWGLNGASTTLPATVNVTPTASINIRPGGYQQVQGSFGTPIDLSIDNGSDPQMVTPINIGDSDMSGNSIYIGSLDQASGADNVDLVLSGNVVLVTNTFFATDIATGHFSIFTSGTLNSSDRIYIWADTTTLGVLGGTSFYAVPGDPSWVYLDSNVGNLNVLGDISAVSPSAGDGGHVTLIAHRSLSAENVYTYGNDTGQAGNVLLQAETGDIFVKAISARGGNTSGNGGHIDLYADTGAITASKFIESRAGTGSTDGVGGHIFIDALGGNANLVSLSSQGSTETAGGGEIDVYVPFGSITIQQFVDSSASPGLGAPDAIGSAGPITLYAGGAVTFGSLRAAGGDADGNGGSIGVTALGGLVTAVPYGSVTVPFVDASACQCTSGILNSGIAGSITVFGSAGVLGGSSFRADGGWSGGTGGNIQINGNTGFAVIGFVSSSAQPPLTSVQATNSNAGTITVIADSGIIASTFRAQGGLGSGNGNEVTLTSGNGDISGSFIHTFGGADGNAANIQVTAGGSISLGEINATAQVNGNAGTITLGADSDITTGLIAAAGGTSSGNGAAISLNTTNGSILVNGYVSSRAKAGDGYGGSIGLIAINGQVAILDVIATGAAIASNGSGTGDAGDIGISYDSSSGDFVIDAAGVNITNGAKGNITAIANGSGSGGTIDIASGNGDTIIDLHSTIDVTSQTGSAGFIAFTSGSGGITVNDNGSGILSGPLLAGTTAGNVTISLSRNNTSLLVAAINAIGCDIQLSSGNTTITAPIGSNIHADGAPGVTLTAQNIINSGSIRALTGAANLSNNGNLTLSGTGTLTGNTITLTSSTGTVNATQNSFSGTITGSSGGDFTLSIPNGSLDIASVTSGGTTISVSASAGNLNLTGTSTYTVTGSGTKAINLRALGGGDLTVSQLQTFVAPGGQAFLYSTDELNTGFLVGDSQTAVGDATKITLSATNNVTAANISAKGGSTSGNGGTVGLFSTNGSISVPVDMFGGEINSSAPGGSGDAGSVSVFASNGGVNIETITATALATTSGNGGTIYIYTNSATSDVVIDSIDNSSFGTGSAGGNVQALDGISIRSGRDINITNYIMGRASINGGSGNGSSVSLTAPGDITVTNYIGTSSLGSSGSGGNITIRGTSGGAGSVTLGTVETLSNAGAAGNVTIWAGDSSTSTSISSGAINATGVTRGGVIQLVNSSQDSSVTNLTVAGNITTDASGLDGLAGAIGIVSSGSIDLADLSARADNNGSSTSALGGSIFVSSGGTGASAISVDNINTSATSGNSGNKAGNVVLLSSDATTGADPANITHGTITQSGGTSGTSLVWGLNGASATLPANLNITPTSSINIRPGGYQQVTGTAGSPLALTIDMGGDSQMVAPINIAAKDGNNNSLYISSLSLVNSNDSLNLFLEGAANVGENLLINSPNSNITIATGNGLVSYGTVDIRANNITALGLVSTVSPGAPSSSPNLLLSAASNLYLSNGVNTSGLNGVGVDGGNGGNVFLYGGQSVITQVITTVGGTSTTGNAGNGGDVVIWAGNSNSAATISTANIGTTGYNGGRIEIINLSPNTDSINLLVGAPIATATGLDGTGGAIAIVSGGSIVVNNVSSQATNASSTSSKGGGVFISSGATGATAINVQAIYTSTTSLSTGNIGGNIILLSAAASSGVDPANILHGTLYPNGGTNGTAFAYGLNGASATVPSSLNVTPTASINIRPGGYQQVAGSAGSPLALTITSGNATTSLIPITIGAVDGSGNSMYLSTVTQAGGLDNLDLVGAGNIVFSDNPSIDFNTGSFSYFTGGTFTTNSAVSVDARKVILGALGGTSITTSQNFNIIGRSGLTSLSSLTTAGPTASLTSSAGNLFINGGVTVANFGNITLGGAAVDYEGLLYTGVTAGSVTIWTAGQAAVGLGGTSVTNTAKFNLTTSELTNISTNQLNIGGGTTTLFSNVDFTSDLLAQVTIDTGTNNGCFSCVAAQPFNGGTYTINSGTTANLYLRLSTLTSGSISAGSVVDIDATGLVSIAGGITTNNNGVINILATDIDYTGTLNTGNGAGQVVLATLGHADMGLGGDTISNTVPFRLTLAELQNVSTGVLDIAGGDTTVFSNLDVSAQNLQYFRIWTNSNNGCIGCIDTLPYNADPQDTGTGYTINGGTSSRVYITASSIVTGAITGGPQVELLAADSLVGTTDTISILGPSAGITTNAGGTIIIRADDLDYSGSLTTGVSQGVVYIRTTNQRPLDIGQVTSGSMNISVAEITNIFTNQLHFQGGATTVHTNLNLSSQSLQGVQIETNIVNGCCGGAYLPYNADPLSTGSAYSFNVGSTSTFYITASTITIGQITAGSYVQLVGQLGTVEINGGITTNNAGSILIRAVDLDYSGTLTTGLTAGNVTLGTVDQANLDIAGPGGNFDLSLSELTSITTGNLYLTGGDTSIYANIDLSAKLLTSFQIITNSVNNCCGGPYLPINADPLSTGSAHSINVGSSTNLYLTGSVVTVGQLTAGPIVQVVAEDLLNMTGTSAGIQTNAGGLVQLTVGAIDYTGTLHTGFQLGSVTISTFGQLSISLGGTSETFNLTTSELANITTNTLTIEGGQITLDSNINLDPNDLARVNMSTNVTSHCCGGPAQPFVGGSFSINVGATSRLFVNASDISVGQITGGPEVELRAIASSLTINGGISTNAGGQIDLVADAISYSGVLNTGNGLGSVNLNPSTLLTTVGLGGTLITNTSTIKLTDTLLQNIQTGTLHIGGGATTVYDDIDLSGSNFTTVFIATNEYNLCCGTASQAYNGGTYTVNVGLADLTITAGTVTTGSLTAGSIAVTANTNPGATLTVPVSAHLFASNGNIALNDYNDGLIQIGANAIISAAGPSAGTGAVFIGNPSLSCCPAGSTPANVNVTTSDSGTIRFGTAGITASAPTNTVSSTATTVTFNTASASLITLGGGVIVSGCGGCGGGGGGPVFPALINSLDFSDQAVIDLITNLQGQGIVGGSLAGGTVILPIGIVQPVISAQNIPSGLTVTAMTNGAPLYGWVVDIDAQSTTSQVIIGGTMYFTNIVPANTGGAYIDVSSNQAGPVMVISGTGEVISDGGFNVNANGAISNAGSITAHTIQLYTTGATGNITTTPLVSTLDNPIFTVTLRASQALTINGDIQTEFGGAIYLTGASIDFSGNLDTGVGAGLVNLSTISNAIIGGIGGSSHTAPWHVDQNDLNRISTDSLQIFAGELTQYGNIDLSAKNWYSVEVRTNGGAGSYHPYIGGSNTWNLSTLTRLYITAQTLTVGSISAGPEVSLIAAETPGTLTVNGNITTANAGTLTLAGYTMDFTGTLNTGLTSGNIYLKTIEVNTDASMGGNSEAWNLTNSELANLTTGNLFIYTGQMTLDSNIDLTANALENVTISTNVNLPLTLYKPFIGGSLSVTVGTQTTITINASTLSVGAIDAGNYAVLMATGALTVNGNITTINGGTIDLTGATMEFTGTLSTGSSAGNVYLRTPTSDVVSGIGGSSETDPWHVTNAELANIQTGNLFIYTGPLTQYSNIDFSGNNFDNVTVRTNANLPLMDFNPYNGGSFTYNMGASSLDIGAYSISVGAITAGTFVTLYAHDSTLDVAGNITTGNGGTISLTGSTMDYTGILNTGSSVGTVNLQVNDTAVIAGLGGDNLSNTAPWKLTAAKLQNITTGNLYIYSGEITVFDNLDLTANALDNFTVQTDGGFPLTNFEAFIGTTMSINVGPQTNLTINAASITTGSITAGPTASLRAYYTTLDITGNITTNTDGTVLLYGGTLDFTGTINTGGSGHGTTYFQVNDNDVVGGIGGTAVTNTAPWNLTLAELQNTSTGAIYIDSGAITVYSDIDLTTMAPEFHVNTGYFGGGAYQNYDGGNFILNVDGPGDLFITAANIVTGSLIGNSVTVNNTAGTLIIPASAEILAEGGNVVLQNSDTTNGTIILGTNSTVTSINGAVNGNIYIFIGNSIPGSPAVGPTPSNTVLNPTNGGQIFFDTNGITGNAPTNTVNTSGGLVVFSTGSRPQSSIVMNGGVVINSNNPPPGGPIFSLDFTDPTLTALILSLQGTSDIGGTLIINGNGVATGGNAIIGTGMLANTLSGHNIPNGVTITLDGYQLGDAVNVEITSSSYTPYAIVAGTLEFDSSGPASNGSITINSDQVGPVLTITGTGLITSDGSLGINVNGNVVMQGALSATTSLNLFTTNNNGAIALSGPVTAGTTATLIANGSGAISQTAGTITATTLNMSSTTGTIGDATNRIQTAVSNLAANTARDVFITNTGSGTLTLNASSGANFQVFNNRSINVAQAINATRGTRIYSTANDGAITLNSTISSPDYVVLWADGSGNINQNSGTLWTSGAYLLTGTGNIGSLSQPIQTGAFYLRFTTTGGDVYINSNNSLRIQEPSTGGTVDITSNGQIEVAFPISANNLTFHGAGSIILSANVTASSFVTLYGQGHGNIINNGGSLITPTLTASTGSGTIGSQTTSLDTSATNITTSNQGAEHLNTTSSQDTTVSSSSNAYTDITSNGNLNISGAISGTEGVTVNSGGSLTVNDVTANNGSVELTAGSGTLTVNTGATIYANEGDITLHNNDSTGSILLSQNSTVYAYTSSPVSGLGNVTITVGTSIGTSGSVPGNVTTDIQGGGQILIGDNGFTSNVSTNSLNAIGATITIDAGASGSITLEGATITADPPIIPSSSENSQAIATISAPAEIANVLPLLKVTNTSSTSPTTSASRVTSSTAGITALHAQVPTDTARASTPTFASQFPSQANLINTNINQLSNQLNVVNTGITTQPVTIQPLAPTSTEPTRSQAGDSDSDKPAYLPIAFTSSAPNTPVITRASNELSQLDYASCLVRYVGSAELTTDAQGNLNLTSGEVLIHSSHPTVITAGPYAISIAAGCVALVTKDAQVLKVRNLYGSSSDSVVIAAADQQLKAISGQEIMLANHKTHLQVAMQKDGLGRRHVTEAELANGHAMTRCEISHMHLMQESAVLAKLMHAKTGSDRVLADKLLKMAACLMTVTTGHGAYSAK